MDGFLLIDKPIGMTSHDVVFKAKRKLSLDKVGHTGTLDPFARGLLILCIGKATKLAHLFQQKDKDYEGTMVFGKHYDTYDTTGNVLENHAVEVNDSDLDKAIQGMVGTYDQTPPMYAAIKMDGQKLYNIARRGETIERPSRTVEIFEFKRVSPYAHQRFDFFISVSKGTYVRSVAVDLAKRLDTFGALESLNRIRIGAYALSRAKTLDDVEKHDIISLEDFFFNFPSITLNDYMIKLVRNGIYLDERQLVTESPFVVRDNEGHLIAYYEVHSDKRYQPVLIL